jgi:hypothetical protein
MARKVAAALGRRMEDGRSQREHHAMTGAVGSFRRACIEIERWPVYMISHVSDSPISAVALHEWLGLPS